MRAFLSAVALLVAGPALAQSIDVVPSLPKGAPNESVTRVACPSCPPLQPAKSSYNVPSLPPGQQTMELRTVAGKQKVYRTEAWLGGSPVVFVSTATPAMIAALQPQPAKAHDPVGDGIDRTAETAAVSVSAHHPLQLKAPVAAGMAAPAAAPVPVKLDTAEFSLRTN